MPLELGNDPNQHWYFFEYNEFKLIVLFWPWTLETPTEQLKVVITRIDFTLKSQLRLRLQAHPEAEPLFSKFSRFITMTKFHEHFASAIAPIQDYHDFPEIGFPEVDLTVLNSLLTDPVVN